MRIAGSIKGIEQAYFKVLDLLPRSSLKELAQQIRPRVPLSSSPRVLRREVEEYITRNYKGSKFYVGLIEFMKDTLPKTSLSSVLSEPKREEDLKPLIKKALMAKRFKVYESEVPIPPATRADIVGYRSGKKTRVTKWWPITHRPRETETKRWYVFLGFELKTAKRGKEPFDRQVSVYAKYFDNAFAVVTPLTLLEHGYDYFRHLQGELRSRGVGLILATKKRIIGTIISSRTNSVAQSNKRFLIKKMRLRT